MLEIESGLLTDGQGKVVPVYLHPFLTSTLAESEW